MQDRSILDHAPLPVARSYRRYRNAEEIRERHDTAYFLFEVYLKYVTAGSIAHYLAGEARNHRVNAALKGLARPSLGEWVRFLRECTRFLSKEGERDPAIDALSTLYETKERRWKTVVRLANEFRAWRTGETHCCCPRCRRRSGR